MSVEKDQAEVGALTGGDGLGHLRVVLAGLDHDVDLGVAELEVVHHRLDRGRLAVGEEVPGTRWCASGSPAAPTGPPVEAPGVQPVANRATPRAVPSRVRRFMVVLLELDKGAPALIGKLTNHRESIDRRGPGGRRQGPGRALPRSRRAPPRAPARSPPVRPARPRLRPARPGVRASARPGRVGSVHARPFGLAGPKRPSG